MKVYLLIYLVTIILCIIETNLEYVTIGVRKNFNFCFFHNYYIPIYIIVRGFALRSIGS